MCSLQQASCSVFARCSRVLTTTPRLVTLAATALLLTAAPPTQTVNRAITFDDDRDPSTACVAWTVCKPGERMLEQGSSRHDRKCTSCERGRFSTLDDVESCSPPGRAATPASSSLPRARRLQARAVKIARWVVSRRATTRSVQFGAIATQVNTFPPPAVRRTIASAATRPRYVH